MSEISDNKKPRIQVLQDRIRNLRLERDQLRAKIENADVILGNLTAERDQLRAELDESKATLAAIKKVVHATTLIVTGEDGNPVEREPNLVGCVQLVEAERDRLRGLYKQRDQWREVAVQLSRSKKCPNCDDVGFYVIENRQGEPEQCQCQWCYTTPQSRFNALAAYDRLVKEGA